MKTARADFLGLSPALQLTLGGSVLLHTVLLFGLPAPAAGQHSTGPRVLQAQLAPATASQSVATAAPHRPTPSVPLQNSTPIDEPMQTPVTAAPPPPQPAALASPGDDGYFSAAQLDSPPRLLGELQQVYPARARAAEVEGYVTLALLINERGEVEEVSVVKAQPAGYFEEAALAMLRKQRFTPPIKQNHAVKSRWLTTVRYRLQS